MKSDDKNKSIENAENTQDCENAQKAESKEILDELKDAYKSVNALKESPSHRKILLDIERKIRKEQKKEQKN